MLTAEAGLLVLVQARRTCVGASLHDLRHRHLPARHVQLPPDVAVASVVIVVVVLAVAAGIAVVDRLDAGAEVTVSQRRLWPAALCVVHRE